METGSAPCNAALNGAASLGSPAGRNSSRGFLLQLPTELVIKIFQFALPSVDCMLNEVEAQLLSYMRTLSTIQLIARRWQQIVDGTPAFWRFIISTLPSHVNEATIIRSKNGPLTIIYTYGLMYPGGPEPSAEDFLGSLAHTFPRWSAYSGPLVSGYFHMPAPHLQTMVLRAGEADIGTLDLFGGSAKHLRHVDLHGIQIRWKTGLFAQLKVLKLLNEPRVGIRLTTIHLLDALRASPCLEHLELASVDATMDHLPCSPAITYPSLRYIRFSGCDHRFAGTILRHIRAPSCSEFYLRVFMDDDEQDLPIFLGEDLQNFKELLHVGHLLNGCSEITLDGYGFGWNIPAEDVVHPPRFSVFIFCTSPIPCISWVEGILQGDPGLSIRFDFDEGIAQEVLESIKPMRCATRLEIEHLWSVQWCLLALKVISEPLSTDPSSPPLPCLQELLLAGIEWTPQNVLDMVHSRFNSLLWEGTKRTPLTIKMPRGAFLADRLPRPIFDFTTLVKIRETDGVESVQFVGSEELSGSLAITWDEQKSAPAWG